MCFTAWTFEKEIYVKKFVGYILVLAVAAAACSSKKAETAKLSQDSPAFQLGKDLSAILPVLDPGKNAVLATAEDFTVTAGELLDFLQGMGGGQTAQLKSMDALGLKGLVTLYVDQLGERKLMLKAAAEAKIAVSAEDVTSTLAQQYDQAGGEPQYLESLKTNGISIEFVRQMIRETLTMQQHLEKNVFASIRVAEPELRNAYAEDKTASVRHILLMTQGKPEAEKPEIRKKMEGLLARAKKGEDFAALAKQFTEDAGSKEKGGLYEDFPKGQMVKPFEDAAFTVPVGQISDIVETQFGYHILKVEGRQRETRPFEEAKAEIENRLKEQKKGAAYQTFIADLKTKSSFKLVLETPAGK